MSSAGRVPAAVDAIPDEESDTPPALLDTLPFFDTGDFAYYVPRCLNRLGIVSPPAAQPDGQFWTLILERPPRGKVAIVVGLDATKQVLIVEAPLVRLPPVAEAPILRAALELNGHQLHGTRVSLRENSLILRCTGPVGALRPLLLVNLLMSFADRWLALTRFFASRFGCAPYAAPVEVSSFRPSPRRAPIQIKLEGGPG